MTSLAEDTVVTKLPLRPVIEWKVKAFQELTVLELYDIIQLRNEVFVLEQACLFQDADGIDLQAYHILGYIPYQNDGHDSKRQLIAYSRLMKDGVVYCYPSIGRIVLKPSYRSFGFGKDLVRISIENCIKLFGDKSIQIGAQHRLQKFYESFGFENCSEPYDEDGIIHIQMIRKPSCV